MNLIYECINDKKEKYVLTIYNQNQKVLKTAHVIHVHVYVLGILCLNAVMLAVMISIGLLVQF